MTDSRRQVDEIAALHVVRLVASVGVGGTEGLNRTDCGGRPAESFRLSEAPGGLLHVQFTVVMTDHAARAG